MVQKVKALDQEILTLEKEYRDFPPYVPRVIETDDGRPQPSDVAREVGNLVDWALLLLPGSAINKGLSFLSKGKGVKKVADIIGATGNARKVIDVGDKIKDAAFMARSIGMTAEGKNALRGQHQGDEMRCFDLSNQSGKTDKFSLDWLTVQHWAVQIASNFDRPPVLSVDKEYEGQYMKEKRRLERQIIEEQRCSHLQKCELRLYKDEKDKRDAERKALIADEKRLGEELRIREQEIRKNAERSAYENWVLQCSTSYRAKAEQKLNEMLAQYRNVIPGRLQQYQETRLQGLRKKLENEEMSYRNISEAGDDAIEQEIIKIGALMQGLRSVEV
jgi:hypothetical protein